MSKNIRKRRDKLWIEKDKKCYWCGIDTVLPQRGNNRALPTPNLATLDHLRTRMDHNRTEPNNTNEERSVLSCWRCNQLRGICDQKATQDILINIQPSRFIIRLEPDDKMI
jgi:hypothetical protein